MENNTFINISDDSDFALLRQSGGIYVDKTEFLYRLLTWNLKKRFFVSRPRRFGKSLMISTLKYILQGQKELFKGTYIYDQTDYDWPVVPVIHLDFSGIDDTSLDAFYESLSFNLRRQLNQSGAGLVDVNLAPGDMLAQALDNLSNYGKTPVAVLIDEYDAPIGHTLDRLELANKIREKLSKVYIKLKEMSSSIRFLMLTGVSKFSQLSIFSGLNNLTDLHRYDEFATMFGYTDRELEDNFGDLMQAHAKVMGLSEKSYRAELKRWYNGYCFKRDAESVYNPMAIAKTLSEQAMAFQSTWTADCRPTLLVNYLKQAFYSGENFEHGVLVYPNELGNVSNLDALQLTDVLYQSGYLTIDHYDEEEGQLALKVPDFEIRQDLSALLLSVSRKDVQSTNGMRPAFINGKVQLFLELLKKYYAKMVYGSTEQEVTEGNYQRMLQAFFDVATINNTPEPHQANGNRADLVAQYGDYVWVFELKRAKYATAEDALQQIIDRDYVAPYIEPGRTLFQIGLAFDDASHHLIDTKVRQFTVPVPAE